MIFNWDINLWAITTVPGDLRKTRVLRWVISLLAPVRAVWVDFIAYRTEINKTVRYNGQTIILENLLNDLFDPTLRRIYIETITDVLSVPYVFTAAENEPLYIYTAAEATPVYTWQYSELSFSYSFTVFVPDGILTEAQEAQIKAQTNRYRLAGRKARYMYFTSLTEF